MKQKIVYILFVVLLVATLLLPQVIEDLSFKAAIVAIALDFELLYAGAHIINRQVEEEE